MSFHPTPAAIEYEISHMMTQNNLKHLGDDRRMFPVEAHTMIAEAIRLACAKKDAE